MTVAVCPLLKASGHGRTGQAAQKHLRDAISLKIQVWMDNGELPEILRSYGFRPMALGGREHWVAFGDSEGCQSFDMKSRLRIRKQPKATEPEASAQLPLNFPWYIASESPKHPWAA